MHVADATADRGGPSATQLQAGGENALWTGLVGAAALLVLVSAVVAPPLSRLLFPPANVHFYAFYASLVHPKPVQQTSYLLAVVLSIAAAIGLARLGWGRARGDGRILAGVAAAAKLLGAGLAIWCFRRYESSSQEVGVDHLRVLDVIGGTVLALVAVMLVWRRPGVVSGDERARTGIGRWGWPGLAALATGCWLMPAILLGRNVGHALYSVWWHVQFVYGDFVATFNGRTPLVDYNSEYSSLLPLAVEAPLRLLGPSVGSFTVVMCLLTLAALIAVQRSLALVSRGERLAVVLYMPFLAASLFTVYHANGERFYFANYYAVFPLRYLGPYLLLWLCVRHLRGLRPRGAAWLFLLGGLATLNDVEFGLPALAATVLALAAAAPRYQPIGRWLLPLVRALALGLAAALTGVVVVLWLRTGQLIELGRLTRYAALFGRAGFGGNSTPTIGLHLVIYATFVAVLSIAALRHRREAADRALTGALAFAGVFGLGAGSYYMGDSFPTHLVAIFSVWSLAVALLVLLSVRALAARAVDSTARPPVFAVATALVMFGLLATALIQFPAPWTQLRRISARAPAQVYDRTAASAFVRRTAVRGEKVVVLESLGPLIASEAGVENVSPYSEVWAIWSQEQLVEIVGALRRAHGTRFYLGRTGTVAEIPLALAADGFRKVAYDAPSELTEWRLAGA